MQEAGMMKWFGAASGLLVAGILLMARPGWTQEAAYQGLNITEGDRRITLRWTPVEDPDLSHYELYRSVYNGYIRVDRTASSYTDTNLENGVTYYYSLVAVNVNGDKREIAQRTPATPVDLAPAAPQNFKAGGRNQEVRLSWTPNRERDLARYLLYRSGGDPPGDGAPIATLKKTDSTYVDTGLTNETMYTYTLVAIDDTWNRSEPAKDTGVPGHVPEGVTALAGDQRVYLSWNPNPYPGISHYLLYRTTEKKEIPDTQDMIARIDVNDTTYTDSGLQYGLTYYYYLAMADEQGYSNIYVDPVSAAPQDLAPQAPGGLQVTTAVHDAVLQWTQSLEEDVTGYYLYRSLSSESEEEAEIPIAQVQRDQTTYTDPGLKAGTTYYYFLVAEDQTGKRSVRSPQVSATIPKPRYKARDLTFFLLATQFFLVPLAIAF
jgi:fibronectin type 3 domain-containing protein